jgi:hypothetical protein
MKCSCPQCTADRWGNRLCWGAFAFAFLYFALQVARWIL